MQSVIGLFLHSNSTPEKVIELFARASLSISPDAIMKAVDSLSQEALEITRKVGKTGLVSYAYDNFDVELPTTLHGIEQTASNSHHLTSGTLIPLEHGVCLDDLRCSNELWEKSAFNDLSLQKQLFPHVFKVISLVHTKPSPKPKMNHHDHFNAFMFRHSLVHHGPEAFQAFL